MPERIVAMSEKRETQPRLCPWCKTRPRVAHYESAGAGWDVECINEDCPVEPSLVRWFGTYDEAVTIWNSMGRVRREGSRPGREEEVIT